MVRHDAKWKLGPKGMAMLGAIFTPTKAVSKMDLSRGAGVSAEEVAEECRRGEESHYQIEAEWEDLTSRTRPTAEKAAVACLVVIGMSEIADDCCSVPIQSVFVCVKTATKGVGPFVSCSDMVESRPLAG